MVLLRVFLPLFACVLSVCDLMDTLALAADNGNKPLVSNTGQEIVFPATNLGGGALVQFMQLLRKEKSSAEKSLVSMPRA